VYSIPGSYPHCSAVSPYPGSIPVRVAGTGCLDKTTFFIKTGVICQCGISGKKLDASGFLKIYEK
jgi:hypothetical protein